MNRKVKTLLSILLVTIALVSITTNVFALTPGDVKPVNGGDTKGVEDVGKKIVGIIQTIGILVSVIVLMVLGVKYMMGSAQEKAEYKKVFIPYLVGAALLFAASAFAQAIYDFFTPKEAEEATNALINMIFLA